MGALHARWRRGAKGKAEAQGGGARAEVSTCRMQKRTVGKVLLCHFSQFLSFSSFPVCNCGQV